MGRGLDKTKNEEKKDTGSSGGNTLTPSGSLAIYKMSRKIIWLEGEEEGRVGGEGRSGGESRRI